MHYEDWESVSRTGLDIVSEAGEPGPSMALLATEMLRCHLLLKTQKVSFQGKQCKTKGISYFLRNISANMQPTLQRSTGVA